MELAALVAVAAAAVFAAFYFWPQRVPDWALFAAGLGLALALRLWGAK